MDAQSHDKGDCCPMQQESYREGYFMSAQEENTAAGNILSRHNEAKRRLVTLQDEAKRISGGISEIADLLRKGPPYSIIPATGFLDGECIQNLFKDLHDTYEEKTDLAQKLKDLE